MTTDEMFKYDAERNEWRDATSLPLPLTDFACATYNGLGLLCGGYEAKDGQLIVRSW